MLAVLVWLALEMNCLTTLRKGWSECKLIALARLSAWFCREFNLADRCLFTETSRLSDCYLRCEALTSWVG